MGAMPMLGHSTAHRIAVMLACTRICVRQFAQDMVVQRSCHALAYSRNFVQPTTETFASPRFAASRKGAGALDTVSW